MNNTANSLRRTGLVTTAAAALLLVSGCATPTRIPDTRDTIQDSLDQATANAAAERRRSGPPPEVAAELLPPINLNIPGVDAGETEPRFDVRVRNARARDFFLSLVDGTPYNILVHPEVSGRVTLDLKNVTVPEVMEAVRAAYGYEFEAVPNGFRVLPNQPITRIFQVNYLDMQRSGASGMLASPGEVSASGSTDTNTAATDQASRNSGSYSRVETSSSSQFWTALRSSLSQIVGTEDGRSVTVNPQAGLVVIRALPSEIRHARDFLDAIQNVAHRQVILEARILEVSLSEGFQQGINWAQIARSGTDSAVAGQFGGNTLLSGQGTSNLSGQSGILDPSTAAGVTAIRNQVTSAFGGMFAMAVDTGDFTAFIELLETQGDVQVLSSPRVSTVNNQKAVIKVGQDEFFVTGIDTNTTTGTATSQSTNVRLTPFFSGVALDVTPQISAEGMVILHVHPAVSEVDEQVKSINTTTNQSLRLPLATSTIRESDSVIRARNRQIVVIGGLMQTRTDDQKASIPGLSDVPWVGGLFRQKAKAKTKTELVILLKPVIVTDDQVWEDQLRRTSGVFQQLGTPQRQ